MHVNLLPSSFVWRRLFFKRLRQWGFAFSAISIVLLLGNAKLLGEWWTGFNKLQESKTAEFPIRQRQQDLLKETKETAAIEQKLQQLHSAASQDHSTAILGIVAKGVHATGNTVQIQEMQFLDSSKPIVTSSGTGDAPRNSATQQIASVELKLPASERQLSLRGIAIESESISTLMQSLEESGVFSKVELRSTQERLILDRSVQEFQLECINLE